MPYSDLTGAEALITSLAKCGVSHCFANPGTSEMHFMRALDVSPDIKSVLCLFEGVASGAADGFARITGEPAMTLLHLGAGLMNAGANIHNARRAHSPMINIIGDHARDHIKNDAPLASDIAGIAGPNSIWVQTLPNTELAGAYGVEAYQASLGRPAGPVSLILPADCAWSVGGQVAVPAVKPAFDEPETEQVVDCVKAIKAAQNPALLINGTALVGKGLGYAAALKAAGIRVLSDTFVARQSRGVGRFVPDRMQYFVEAARTDLNEVDLVVLAGTKNPVAFFAYPDKPNNMLAESCQIINLGDAEMDSAILLAALCEAMDLIIPATSANYLDMDCPSGALDPASIGISINRHMPENSIISDDGVTASLPIFLATANARPHDWLMLTGGAIGQGMPLAIGAAFARPDAPVICLSGDGAGMYTNQALWTMAREGLDITTIIFVNHSYRILHIEMARTGSGQLEGAAKHMLNLDQPQIDWVGLAKAQGVAGYDARSAEAFDQLLARALAEPGPSLIAAHIT